MKKKAHRRYELLLPRKFNDGRSVPQHLFTEAFLELESRFGGVSAETQTIRGRWRHKGRTYRDELVRFFVDVPDTRKNRAFMLAFKDLVKERFQQLDVSLTSHPIEVH